MLIDSMHTMQSVIGMAFFYGRLRWRIFSGWGPIFCGVVVGALGVTVVLCLWGLLLVGAGFGGRSFSKPGFDSFMTNSFGLCADNGCQFNLLYF